MEAVWIGLLIVIALFGLVWLAVSVTGITVETVRAIRGAIDDYVRRR